MAYLLDANVFIQASNLHYGFDLCPGFWQWTEEAAVLNKAFSIEQIQDELLAGEDELSDWAKGNKAIFRKINAATTESLTAVSNWVSNQQYTESALSQFLQVADYYLIAYAHANDHTIVTHEVLSNATKKVKIPDVCVGMGIDWVNTFSMLKRERVKFILNQSGQISLI